MKQIKIFQIGCGKMSKYIMKYAYDLGYTIVGAVDIDENKIGKDIGTIIGSETKDITIHDISHLNDLLKETKPDIAIVSTMSYLNDIENILRTCIKNGVNIITTSEESFYPQNSNPTLYRELNILAEANNVTITGSGYQDVFWGNMISNLASSIHNITKIKGISSYNIEDYGISLAKAHGAGLTLEEFESKIAINNTINQKDTEDLIKSRKFKPPYMWNTAGWLAAKLNLTPTKITSKSIPITIDKEINSTVLNMKIASGIVTGMRAIVTLNTKEGITLELENIGKVYTEEDYDLNKWTIEGEPTTSLEIKNPDTVKLTCANIVNRITDVIDADPGFIPTCLISEPTYKIGVEHANENE